MALAFEHTITFLHFCRITVGDLSAGNGCQLVLKMVPRRLNFVLRWLRKGHTDCSARVAMSVERASLIKHE